MANDIDAKEREIAKRNLDTALLRLTDITKRGMDNEQWIWFDHAVRLLQNVRKNLEKGE